MFGKGVCMSLVFCYKGYYTTILMKLGHFGDHEYARIPLALQDLLYT